MGRMLVACDGSEHSKKALEKAMNLAVEGDEIVVIYVIPQALIEEFKGVIPEVTMAEAQEVVNQALEILKSRGKKGMAIVRQGNIAEQIIHFARELECSLIIIGSKGMSKIATFALGSVAEHVAKDADRPVLIVK